jgi:hypothetical protein
MIGWLSQKVSLSAELGVAVHSLPTGGHFWSLAHKTVHVAGVVADFRIGMDIEKPSPVPRGFIALLRIKQQ